MRLEDLTDVHAARHAERVEHDIGMGAVLEERHVLDRHDARHDTLVAVTAGHLVARLDLALHGHEDLDHLHDAGRKLVAALQLLDLVEEALLEALLRLVVLLLHGLDLGHQSIVFDRELPPLRPRILVEELAGDLRVLLEALRARNAALADEDLGQARIGVAVEDRLLVVAVLRETLDLLALDGLGALVLVDAVTVEDTDFDDGAGHARGHAQRGVADVGGLLAEDGAQKLLFRRHRAFALRRDLADEDVARMDLGADIDDAGLVEVLQRLFRHVRNVARDFLRTQLRVAGHHLELLDVDRGEDVFLHDPLGEQDRVFEVVAVPRHERDEHVPAERQLAELGRRTVGDDVALAHDVAGADQRLLRDAGRLVGALELLQAVDVDAGTGRIRVLRRADNDTGRVHLVDDAGAAGRDGGAGITGHDRFHAGADERSVRLHQRHGLTLHVRAHESAVRVVVLEERDERGRDRHELLRRHLHEVDAIGSHDDVFTGAAADHELFRQRAVVDRAASWPGRCCTSPLPWPRGRSPRPSRGCRARGGTASR